MLVLYKQQFTVHSQEFIVKSKAKLFDTDGTEKMDLQG